MAQPPEVSLVVAESTEPLPEDSRALDQLITEELRWESSVKLAVEWRFGRFARLLAAFATGRHYERLGFKDITAYLDSKAKEMGRSRSSLYGAYWVGLRLCPHLEESQMKRLGKSKLYLIAASVGPDGDRPRPEVVAAAEQMHYEEFEAFLRNKRPLLQGETQEDLDLVKVQPFWVRRQDRELVDKVFDIVRQREGLDSRAAIFIRVIEIAHASILQEPPEPHEVIDAEFTEVQGA